MHSKLFKAETSQLFSDNNFSDYNDTSNVVVESTEDGKTRFYCRRPDGTIYDKKVELASKPKYKWCSDNYGSKNVEVCQAKAIGIGRLSSAKRGDGRGSYCWADIEVSYDETRDTYTITYIPHPTIISGIYAEGGISGISGVLCFQFRDFGQPACVRRRIYSSGNPRRTRRRKYGNSNISEYQKSVGRLNRSNFRFLSADYYYSGNTPGFSIVIPDIRYRYEAEVDGRDMRNRFVDAVLSGRNIREFNNVQIRYDIPNPQINTPLIGMISGSQFDPTSPENDVKPYNNDINDFPRKQRTRNSVRNNKHRLEIKCRYVLCTCPSINVNNPSIFINSVRRCNSQVFTGVVSMDGAGIVYEN